MKKITDKLITIVFLCIGFFSSFLSIKARNKVGSFLGVFAYYILKKRRQIAEENLIFAFPNYNISKIKKIAKGSFCNLGITFFELFAMPKMSDADLHSTIQYENIELIDEVRNRNRGIIFLSGHFGNWELLAYSIGVFTNLPITIIVKPQSNTYIDFLLNTYRTSRNNKIVSMYSAARTVISVITKGEVIALLADQSATEDKDLYIDFFGRESATYKVVSDLALRFQIPIVMGFAKRQLEDATYKVKLLELDYSDLQNNKEGVLELTKRHVKILEESIRQAPDHWTWMHKRWKHTKKNI